MGTGHFLGKLSLAGAGNFNITESEPRDSRKEASRTFFVPETVEVANKRLCLRV
jgi:hypothetical protein